MSLLKSNKVKTESKTLHFDMKKRRALSAIIGFSYAFIFFFAGTLDIFVSNNALIFVPFSRVILIAATAFLLAGACLTILFFLIPHKLYTQGILISLGIFVAGYLQGTFLNPNLGGLTGDEVVWGDFLSVTIVTSLIWVVLIFAPSILISPRISDAKSFAKITYAVCGIVCGMQAVGLIGNITTSDVFVSKNFGQYLNADKEFEVSSQKNIMLFIVDRLDGQYVNEVIEDDPSFFERLDGFTQFDNATSSFSWTYPSATYINTGVFRLCDIPATQYFEEAWGGSEYISLLKENNYELNYSMSLGFAYSDVGQLIDIADNLMEEEIQNKFFPTMTSFLNLSAYRYAPMLLKPTLWMAEVDFPYTVSTGTKVACDDDALFYRRFLENGLTVQKKTNNYQYIHFNGSHAPFIMDENALPSEDTGLVKQTKGCFKI
ncbi:MAG: hypothetical protein FWF94_02510, partial [Oscillospiraceae bacterium]|nr:hypothetical protein [Oscillospiraceae bacterium]